MAISPTNLTRVSTSLKTSVSIQTLSRTQRSLLQVQNQLSTGLRLTNPSDDPADASVILQLQKTLENRQAFLDNISQASSQLSEVDSTIGDLTELLTEAQSIASANVGSDVTQAQRDGAAEIVQRLYSQALSLGNRQFNGAYLFGGERANAAPFVEANGGVQFVGTDGVLANRFDEGAVMPFTVGASEVFGAVTARVAGTMALAPGLATATRLADVAGAGGAGVRLGPITLSNGSVTRVVDLSGADSIGDVISRINAAGVGGITASVAPGGTGLQLTGGAGEDITVTDVGSGTAAADLGILRAAGAGAGVALVGTSVAPRLTGMSLLSGLNGGAGIDLSGGMVITNGSTSATVNFSSCTTVEEMLNRINGAGLGVRAEVNAAGTGIDLVNLTQGIGLTVAEGGGTTAADLGLTTAAPVAADGVFAGLAKLRDALRAGDQAGITAAATALKADHDRAVRVRATTGARVRELDDRQTRVEDQNLATKVMLSELRDVDYTEAIARFQTLQTALQATLQTAGRTLNLSLLDFLS